MPHPIPQSVAKRVPLKVYLTDGVSDALAKTVAVVISKNGAAFGNPSAGATNATEIGLGWYYVDLSTTDTDTTGPLIVRGTGTGVDNTALVYSVVNAHNAGFDGLPNAVAGASGGLPLLDAALTVAANLKAILGTALTETAGQIAAAFKKLYDVATPVLTAASVNQTGDNYTRLGANGAGLTALGDARLANLDAAVSSRLASGSYSAPDNATIVAIAGYVDSEVAAIKAKTDNLPAAPAAVGDIPTANANADALLDRAAGVETGLTPRQALRLFAAALLGKMSGAAANAPVFRNTGDTKDRIIAVTDADGNRLSVALDPS